MKNNLPRLAASAACLLPILLFMPLFYSAANSPAVLPVERPKKSGAVHDFAGTLSCTGRGCHGAITPNNAPTLRQDEFTTWVRHDPHATAYEVLKGARAQRMATNLAVTNASKKPIPAHEDPRCLACHSTPQFAADPLSTTQGISCEACHGAALKGGEGWLVMHTTRAWKDLNAAGKEMHGMNDLSAPRVEARVCAGCHAGAAPDAKDGVPVRDLNHDLMAAGHPRLLFEMSTFQANLPPHWRRDKYKADHAHEAKLWAAGRVESARTSLELLKWRASEEAGTSKPWPEFAETDCFACHAALRPTRTDWRYRPGYRDAQVRRPGLFPYNVWFSADLPALAKAVGGTDEPLQKQFTELAHLMSKPLPDRAAVVKQADVTLQQLTALGGKVHGMSGDKAQVGGLLKALAAANSPKLAALSWDEAAQLVYALATLYEASPDAVSAKPAEVTQQFDKLYKALAFPPGFESPASFRIQGATKESDQLTKELGELLKLLTP